MKRVDVGGPSQPRIPGFARSPASGQKADVTLRATPVLSRKRGIPVILVLKLTEGDSQCIRKYI